MRHALARGVQDTEVELGLSMVLVSRLEEPMRCLRILLRVSIVGESKSQTELSLRIATLGLRSRSFHGGIFTSAEPEAIERSTHDIDYLFCSQLSRSLNKITSDMKGVQLQP